MKKEKSESKLAIVQILEQALTRLKKQNPLASIRGLASQMDVTPSYLSKVFRGERTFPAKSIGDLSRVLRLDHHEVAEIHRLLLMDLELASLSTNTGLRTLDASSKRKLAAGYETLGKNDFWLIEDWYHIAIHNLVTTDNFVQSHDWIAARLGITAAKVENSIRRMLADGYILLNEDGRYQKSQMMVRFPTERSHAIIREFHESMIQKALKQLRLNVAEADFKERLISGVTFAGDPSRINEAKVIIEEAMYKAAEHLAYGNCTEVFQLNLQMFKLTR